MRIFEFISGSEDRNARIGSIGFSSGHAFSTMLKHIDSYWIHLPWATWNDNRSSRYHSDLLPDGELARWAVFFPDE